MSMFLIWLALADSASRTWTTCGVVESRVASSEISLRAVGVFSDSGRLFLAVDLTCDSMSGEAAGILALLDKAALTSLKMHQVRRPLRSMDSVFQIILEGTVSCSDPPAPAQSEEWPQSLSLAESRAQCRMLAVRVGVLHEVL